MKQMYLILLNLLRLSGKIELYQPTFNPQHFFLVNPGAAKRNTHDRLKFIERNIPLPTCRSLIDIGCQIGFFCFNLAAKYPHLNVVGLDQERAANLYTKLLLQLNPHTKLSFERWHLNPDSVKSLAAVDVILFTSVFHHIVWHQGWPAGREIMSQLSHKSKYLVFETGQASETKYPWSKSLNSMGKDETAWLSQFLKETGWQPSAKHQFPTHLNTQRVLFIAKSKHVTINPT